MADYKIFIEEKFQDRGLICKVSFQGKSLSLFFFVGRHELFALNYKVCLWKNYNQYLLVKYTYIDKRKYNKLNLNKKDFLIFLLFYLIWIVWCFSWIEYHLVVANQTEVETWEKWGKSWSDIFIHLLLTMELFSIISFSGLTTIK